MDVTELQDLLMQVIQVQGIDINSPGGNQQLLQMVQNKMNMGGQGRGQFGGHQKQNNRGGYQRNNQGFGPNNQF
jgi:hypothetical protein